MTVFRIWYNKHIHYLITISAHGHAVYCNRKSNVKFALRIIGIRAFNMKAKSYKLNAQKKKKRLDDIQHCTGKTN